MLVADNFQVKYTNTHFFSYVYKICIVCMLSNCVNERRCACIFICLSKLCWLRAIKLFECQTNTFGIRNTQYSIALSVHKKQNVLNTTYTIESRVNCPINSQIIYVESSVAFFICAIHTTLYRVCCIEYTWLFVNAQCFAVLCISHSKYIFWHLNNLIARIEHYF